MHWFLSLPHGLPAVTILTLAAVVVLLGARHFGRGAVQALALAGPVVAALPALWLPSADTFAVTAVLATALIGALLLCADELEMAELRAECAALLLLGSAGAIALATAGDLLSVLIGLETLSMAVAVLTGLGRGRRPVEAAFRFFVLAAASVATMIYGIGLCAYATSSFELGATALAAQPLHDLHFAGLVLVSLGIAFELALVPLQFGALGAYREAPMAFAGFAMTASKLGAVLALGRIAAAHPELQPLLVGLGTLSIVVATLGGLAQRDLRGILAWSAVGHGGFLALALGCGDQGQQATTYYAVVYVGSAALAVTALAGRGGELPFGLPPGDARAEPLGRTRSIALVAALLSLAGVPPSPGFWAKLAVLGPAWHVAGPALTVVAVLGGVIGALYYLRPVPDLIAEFRSAEPGTLPASSRLAIAMAGAAWALFTVLPELAVRLAS